MSRRVQFSDENIEIIEKLKEHYKDYEKTPASPDNVLENNHRLNNYKFDREYMIMAAVKNFLDDLGIEYED